MGSTNADRTELFYSVDAMVQPLRDITTWMDVNWEIMFVWRLLLFGAIWYWGIPRLLYIAYPDNGIAKPNVYKKERFILRLGLILLYIFSEALNFYL